MRRFVLVFLGWVVFLTGSVSAAPPLSKAEKRLNRAKEPTVASLGQRAYKTTQRITMMGPRPSGSSALGKVQEWVAGRLQGWGFEIKRDHFVASTPLGPIPMQNIIAMLPGTSSKTVVIACHLESKRLPKFVGANDSASACALIIEMAPHFKKQRQKSNIWLLFTDGEEAMLEWSDSDSLYGSRHLANAWKEAGLLQSIRAFILLDMIGDKNLQVLHELNSTPELIERTRQVARELGWHHYFFQKQQAISDDHLPFAKLGVPVIDLIDFSYGPNHSYYHSPLDTIDKLSPKSLQIVGEVVLGLVSNLNRDP